MRIAIDATTLLLRSAGVKNYLHYWLLSLVAAAPGHGDSIVTYPLAVPVPQVPDHEESVAGALGTWLRLHAMLFISQIYKEIRRWICSCLDRIDSMRRNT